MAQQEGKAENRPETLDYTGEITEIFVDGFQGVSLLDGVIRINFWQTMFRAGQQPDRVRQVVARLLMPASTFVAMHRVMGTIVEDMEQKGAVVVDSKQPSSEPKSGE